MLQKVYCLLVAAFAGAAAAGSVRGSSQTKAAPSKCHVSNGRWRACGRPNTTEDECRQHSCCYDHSPPPGVPACVANTSDLGGVCDPTAGRADGCGWEGISEESCRNEGCCYGPTDSRSAPQCYQTSRRRQLLETDIPKACVMPDNSRVDCGFEGITPDECVNKGCCYFHATPGHPFCYFRAGMAPASALEAARECESLDEERIDCGYDGVTEDKCKERGCCYKHAVTPGAPFCFYKRNQAPNGAVKGAASQQCVMTDKDRIDCGYDGVTPAACRAKGCCYFHSHTHWAPFCYYMNNQTIAKTKSEDKMCSVPGMERKDCGFKGISAPQCRDSGCCYAPSGVLGSPFCYYKSGDNGHHSPLTTPAPPTLAPSPSNVPVATPVPPVPVLQPQTTLPPTPAPGIGMGSLSGGPGTLSAGGAGTSPLHSSDVMGGNHFRGQGTETQDMADNSRQTLLTVLAAAAIVLVLITGCCLRSQPAAENNPEEASLAKESVPLNDDSAPSTPHGAKCKRLEPDTMSYQVLEKQFRDKWDTTAWPTANGRAVPPPSIAAIYEVDAESRILAYKAKQREIDSQPGGLSADSPGNEAVLFHGARMRGYFEGSPCSDPKCKVSRIIESGSFACDSVGGEIHFRASSHAAKGQGLAPGKTPPPQSLDDFVSSSAGNAVFVANVLLGTPYSVSERTKGPPPPGKHSRIADKMYGVDEIVVFDEAQAIPKALIVFR